MIELILRAVWDGVSMEAVNSCSTVGINNTGAARELAVTIYQPWRVVKLRIAGDMVELYRQSIPSGCGVLVGGWCLGDPGMPDLSQLMTDEILG